MKKMVINTADVLYTHAFPLELNGTDFNVRANYTNEICAEMVKLADFVDKDDADSNVRRYQAYNSIAKKLFKFELSETGEDVTEDFTDNTLVAIFDNYIVNYSEEVTASINDSTPSNRQPKGLQSKPKKNRRKY